MALPKMDNLYPSRCRVEKYNSLNKDYSSEPVYSSKIHELLVLFYFMITQHIYFQSSFQSCSL